ncbi:hypothetical protein BYT27DRAFT_7261979 [Phlegmacium glaucopus]|nr:hypothetical protein BYT27DRAFT_7261979 [Phlegmacium glaucopus]
MPPKASVTPTTATPVLKSPPKTRRSTRKRAQSSTDTAVEPPAKKIATGDGEEGEEKGGSSGKGKKGKGIRQTTLKKRVSASVGKNTSDNVHLTPTEQTLKASAAAIAPPAKPIQKACI